MKVLLKNAAIYDGTGNEPYAGCVLYEDERIVAVAPLIADTAANEVIDLSGLSLSPGFIDSHSHNDWFAIKKEPLKYFEPFIRQGITTFVTGNCGLSSIGFDEDSGHIDKLGGGLFFFQETTGKYGTAEAYFKAIDRNTPCNTAVLAGHCSARAGVAGYSSEKLSPADEKRMLDVLEKNLRQGACGVSLGMMYEPGLYAGIDELKKVAALCVTYDKPLTVHPRASSKISLAYPQLFGRSHCLRALDELVEIAKGTNLKLHYSHAIFVGRQSFGDVDDFLEIMHRLRADGVNAGFDVFCETVGVSVITVILPAWYRSLSEKQRNRLDIKAKLMALVNVSSKLLGFTFDDMQVAYAGKNCRAYEGLTVAEVAKLRKESALNSYLYLCKESDFKGRVNLGPYTTPEIMSRLSKEDMCTYITDAWVEDYGVQNPAVYDCFPKFIHRSLTGAGDTMPRTIRKMTGQSADRFGLKDRGYIREGAFADFTVFNEEKMKTAVPDQGKPFGIERVIINGKTVLAGDVLNTEALKCSGQAIKC